MRIIKKGNRAEQKEQKAQCKGCGALIGYYYIDVKECSEISKNGFYVSLIQYINCPCCGRKIEIWKTSNSIVRTICD